MKHPDLKKGPLAAAKTRALLVFILPLLLCAARADISTGLVAYWPFDDGPGSSTAADSSGNGFTGTLTDFADTSFTSMWVPGRFNDAILFNTNGETSNYVSVPNTGALDFGGTSKAFTLAAWVMLSVPGGSQSNGAPIICKGAGGLEQYSLDITGGVFRGLIRNSSGKSSQVVNSTITPGAGVWYHVAATWTTSPQQQYIYIDGVYNNTYSGGGFLTSELTTNYPFVMGAKESAPGSGFNTPFQGIIDDVHVYNRALTASDIYQLYTNGATSANGPVISTQPRNVSAYIGDSPAFSVFVNSNVTLLPVAYQWKFNSSNIVGATGSSLVVSNVQATNAGTYTVFITNSFGTLTSSNAVLTLSSLPSPDTTSGLVGYWAFDDGAGSSNAADSSGNGNNGLLYYFTDTTYTSMWTNGVFQGALSFNADGTGSNLVAVPGIFSAGPSVLEFGASPVFSLSVWVHGATNQTNGAGIITKGAGNGAEEYVLDVTGGYYRLFVRDAGGNGFTAQTAIAPNNSWQHVAGVLDANNGIMNVYVNGQLAASSAAPFSLQGNTHPVTFGNRQPFGQAYRNAFTGALDDLKIYNRALTSADVTTLYEAKPTPLVITWNTTNYDVVAGANAPLAPSIAGGVPPFTYQWQFNGTNIPGATSFPLVLTNVGQSAGGMYDVIVSDSNYVPSATSSPINVTIEPYLTFNTNGVSWSAQGSIASAIFQGTNIAQLTSLGSAESNSIFYQFPLQVGQFQASFTYQVAKVPGGTTGPGEGGVFCIQNDPRGASALGYNGDGLGVGNISNATTSLAIVPSFDLELNINSANAASTAVSLDTNGALGPFMSTAPLELDNGTAGPGDPINVVLTYEAGVASVTMTDTVSGAVFSSATNLNLPLLLGSSLGYIGFTGSTGNGYAQQQISNFIFQSLVDLNVQTSGANAIITWPVGVGEYVLQETTSLSQPNWINVPQPVTLAGGSNQVTVPFGSSPLFFRLNLLNQ